MELSPHSIKYRGKFPIPEFATVNSSKNFHMPPFVCLLIDDDSDDHEFFEMALRPMQSDVQCVCMGDCTKAIEHLRNGIIAPPKLIFIDINMPRMNGMQCLAKIKAEHFLAEIPIYMYSTSAEPAIVNECINMGASGFLKKEVSIAALETKISEILAKLQGSLICDSPVIRR